MTNGGAGSRGGVSKSTFYRTWRESQLRRGVADDQGPYPLYHGIKRDDLERVLQEEQDARDAARKAITVNHPKLGLGDWLERGVSPLRAWREVRGMTPMEIEAATGISQNILRQLENRTRRPSPEQIVLLAETLSIGVEDMETLLIKSSTT